MVDDRLVQPRQIYASTLTRREHRARRRPRARSPLHLTVRTAAALCAALSVLAVVVPGVG
jgi:ABC-type Fe3+ transport system permease subunit